MSPPLLGLDFCAVAAAGRQEKMVDVKTFYLSAYCTIFRVPFPGYLFVLGAAVRAVREERKEERKNEKKERTNLWSFKLLLELDNMLKKQFGGFIYILPHPRRVGNPGCIALCSASARSLSAVLTKIQRCAPRLWRGGGGTFVRASRICQEFVFSPNGVRTPSP